MNNIVQMTTLSKSSQLYSGKAAFTLIELLVVITIIALLAALVGPALASAKDRGRHAVCLSNMHQLGIAMQMYANDFENRVPQANQDITDPNAGAYPSAPWTIHLQYRRYIPGNTTAQYWQFPADAKKSILLCPSDLPSSWPAPITGDAALMQEYGGSFLYNSETIAVSGHVPKGEVSRKILLIESPPKDAFGLERTFDVSNFSARMKTAAFPTARRHFGKSDALFMDWHVEHIDPSSVTTNMVVLD